MSNQAEQVEPTAVGNLRSMARQGRSPSEMLRELKRSLEGETHIVLLLQYFKQAFCLTLTEVKPIAALSRNEQREIEDDALLDELLTPEILKHHQDWETLNGPPP